MISTWILVLTSWIPASKNFFISKFVVRLNYEMNMLPAGSSSYLVVTFLACCKKGSYFPTLYLMGSFARTAGFDGRFHIKALRSSECRCTIIAISPTLSHVYPIPLLHRSSGSSGGKLLKRDDKNRRWHSRGSNSLFLLPSISRYTYLNKSFW